MIQPADYDRAPGRNGEAWRTMHTALVRSEQHRRTEIRYAIRDDEGKAKAIREIEAKLKVRGVVL